MIAPLLVVLNHIAPFVKRSRHKPPFPLKWLFPFSTGYSTRPSGNLIREASVAGRRWTFMPHVRCWRCGTIYTITLADQRRLWMRDLLFGCYSCLRQEANRRDEPVRLSEFQPRRRNELWDQYFMSSCITTAKRYMVKRQHALIPYRFILIWLTRSGIAVMW